MAHRASWRSARVIYKMSVIPTSLNHLRLAGRRTLHANFHLGKGSKSNLSQIHRDLSQKLNFSVEKSGDRFLFGARLRDEAVLCGAS